MADEEGEDDVTGDRPRRGRRRRKSDAVDNAVNAGCCLFEAAAIAGLVLVSAVAIRSVRVLRQGLR